MNEQSDSTPEKPICAHCEEKQSARRVKGEWLCKECAEAEEQTEMMW